MKRFNPWKVRPLGNLQSKSEKEKKFARRLNGIKVRFSLDTPAPEIKKTRDYLAPVKAGFVPAKPRGKSGCRLSPAKRAMVEMRHEARGRFFASL